MKIGPSQNPLWLGLGMKPSEFVRGSCQRPRNAVAGPQRVLEPLRRGTLAPPRPLRHSAQSMVEAAPQSPRAVVGISNSTLYAHVWSVQVAAARQARTRVGRRRLPAALPGGVGVGAPKPRHCNVGPADERGLDRPQAVPLPSTQDSSSNSVPSD